MSSIKTTILLTLRKQPIPDDLTNIILKFLECKVDGCCNMDIYPLGKSYLDSRNFREVNWNYIIEFRDTNYHQNDCYCFEHMEVNLVALDDILGVEDYDDGNEIDNSESIRFEIYPYIDTDDNYILSEGEILSQEENISEENYYSDGEIFLDYYNDEPGFLGWDFGASCDI